MFLNEKLKFTTIYDAIYEMKENVKCKPSFGYKIWVD